MSSPSVKCSVAEDGIQLVIAHQAERVAAVAHAIVRDDAVVFDMLPATVFATGDGVMVPVDCIPVRLPPGKRDFFDK